MNKVVRASIQLTCSSPRYHGQHSHCHCLQLRIFASKLDPPLTRQHVLHHGHDELVARITVLANISRVRDVKFVRLTIHLYPSKFVLTLIFEVSDRVIEQLWLVARYQTCEIPRHKTLHRSQFQFVSLSTVFNISQHNAKIWGKMLGKMWVFKHCLHQTYALHVTSDVRKGRVLLLETPNLRFL